MASMALMVYRKLATEKHSLAIENDTVVIPHPHHIRNMLKDGLKELLQIVMVAIAKGWMLLVKAWKQMLEREFPKFYDVFYGKPSTEVNHGSSFFLSTITEYKTKMKRLKDKMKREEKMKKDGEEV